MSEPKKKIVVKMAYSKKTPGTYLYKEVLDNPSDPSYAGSIYLKNLGVAALENPGSLVITIEAGD